MKHYYAFLAIVLLIMNGCKDPADHTVPDVALVLKTYEIIYNNPDLRDQLTISYDSVAHSVLSEYEFQSTNATTYLTFDLDFSAPDVLRLDYVESTDYFEDTGTGSDIRQTYDLDLKYEQGDISAIALNVDGEKLFEHQIRKTGESRGVFENYYFVNGTAHKVRYHEFKMSGGNLASLESYVSYYNSDRQFEFVLQRKMEVVFDDNPNPFHQNIHAFYHDLITQCDDEDIIRFLSKNNISGIAHDEFIRDWTGSGVPEFWQHSDHIHSYTYADHGYPEKCWILIDSENVDDFLYSEEYGYQ